MKPNTPHEEYAMEKSCGAVLYKLVEGEPRFALVRGSVFGFPKGHVEQGEREMDTALREIREETGVSAVIDTGFRREVIYHSPRFKNGRKRVIFFLAKCPEDQTPKAGSEIKSLILVPYSDAIRVLKLDTLKKVLEDAYAYMNGRKS